MLDAHRAGSSTKRVGTDERSELLAEFWKKIDAEIANGEVIKA